MTDTVVETERLILRDWRNEDVEPFAAICADPEVMRWLGDLRSLDETAALIGTYRRHQSEAGYTNWAVERKEDRILIGFCGFKRLVRDIPEKGLPEIGWRLRSDLWGNGYAREAAFAALDHGFVALGFDNVFAFTLPANHRSLGLMERLGLARDAALEYFDADYGPKVGIELGYRLSRAEWIERCRETAE